MFEDLHVQNEKDFGKKIRWAGTIFFFPLRRLLGKSSVKEKNTNDSQMDLETTYVKGVIRI